jgi:fumarate reductase subunit D
MKLIVGIIALSLSFLTSLFSENTLNSISASYHEDGWARNIFVGFLFTISAFLLSYNGYFRREMLLSKIAAIAAIGIAMFPSCSIEYPLIAPLLHYTSAAIMFIILAIFCYLFNERALHKGHPEAILRTYIYTICGDVIVVSMAVMALYSIISKLSGFSIDRLVFYGEAISLIAFGVAWLTASLTLPLITSNDERIRLFSSKNKDDSV